MKKELIKNTTLLTLSNFLTRFVGLAFFIVLARMLSVENYGSFRYLLSLSLTYSILFTGFTVALTKYISETKNKKTRSEFFSNSLVITLILLFVTILLSFLLNENPLLLSLFLFASYIDFFYIGLIRGLLNYKKLTFFKLTENLIQFIIMLLAYLIYKEINFITAVIFFAFSGIISLLILELIRKSEIKFSLKFISKDKVKTLSKYALPVMLGAVGWELMFNLNAIFIKLLLNLEEVAFYSVGRTITQVFTFLPLAITTIMMPKVSQTKNKLKIVRYTKYAVIVNLVVSFLGLFILLIIGKQVINIAFGSAYLQAYNVLFYLSLGQIFIASYLIYGSVWQGLGKPIVPSLILLFACIINIVGNLILIPSHGIVGASISTAISSFIAFISSIFIFKKNGIKTIN